MTTDNQEDLMTIRGHPWPQVVRWLLALLVLYTIGSVFISNPFSLFVDRTTPIDYSRAMYFHGMAVGLLHGRRGSHRRHRGRCQPLDGRDKAFYLVSDLFLFRA